MASLADRLDPQVSTSFRRTNDLGLRVAETLMWGNREEAPKLGTSAVAFRFGPATPQSANPWLEQQMTAVLLSDPSQPIALVVSVAAITVHDPPSAKTTTVEPAEFSRIVEAAVNRILEGL